MAFVSFVLLSSTALAGCGRHGSGTAASPRATIAGANAGHGKAIFERECAACHGQYGVGGPVGPSLKNESARRSFQAVRAIVTDPQPPMPKLYPARLTKADVTDVSAYVESL
jgi:mono/diheme cytochrome c family protein